MFNGSEETLIKENNFSWLKVYDDENHGYIDLHYKWLYRIRVVKSYKIDGVSQFD